MKNGFMLFMACAITMAVAVSQDNGKEFNPSATFSPPRQFDASSPPPPHPNATTHHPNTTTPHPNTTTPHPNTTTPHPNTTTPHPNTTTPHPNTTTPHPNTTTPHPNTTTPHPNTTTPLPKTTTPHPNTTTPAPQPTPKTNLTAGNYTLKSGNDVCALANMALEVRVEYGTKNKSEGAYIVQPGKTSVSGTCDKLDVKFNLTFKEGFIVFQFQKNVSEKLVYVSSVAVELTYPFDHADPKTKYAASNNSVKLFPAAIGHSYSCRNQSVYLGKGIHLDMTQVRMQALNITNTNFGLPDPCPADQPDYRVAIAVGIVLLILIIIVIVAYLIGRRRRIDGYQSL
ncbi:macrosialin [Anguilla rostrata]|uniref:macrosialin n=1 Tax=Anguilla rostrata TaxID=7938 RepID=UPI0030CF94C0